MNAPSIADIPFYLVTAVTLISAGGVAFSPNIVHSAFCLMGTFLGVAGLYAMLAADFVAVVQLLVYVGGILVLTLFAVMLTHRIADPTISNRSVGKLPSLGIIAIIAAVMIQAVRTANWKTIVVEGARPTTYGIGNAFLTDYVLPFELASVVLLAALIGAVVLSRKELKG